MAMPAPARFDVFLSHNSREKPVVERLAGKLKRAGLEPWLDAWCLTPGGRWQEELATGLRDSAACAVFIGPHDAGDWEREEVGLALDRAAKNRGFRVFLVLLPGVTEPFDPTALSPFLSTRTWVDLRQGVEGSSSFQAFVNAIKGVPLTASPPAAADPAAVCPYRGLLPFDAEHAEFYFGREAEIQRLVEQLKGTRFLAVLGPSGSGKSSLVRAGLLPSLAQGSLTGSHDWPIRVFTPGAEPLTQLAAQFVAFSGQGTMQETLDRLATDPRTFHLASTLAMADRPASARIVWVVDQFEEVFTLCGNDADRAQFIANLLHASGSDGRAVVIITLRADFYHRCAAHAEFAARVAANQFLVGPMDREGLRQAIEEPARLAGLEFEEGLVATIVEAVEGQPGALPLLEHSLLELWQRRRAGMLTLEGYRESGGVSGALARRADAIYDGFDDVQQAVARRLLLRLTQIGEGTEDTRRRAAMSELATRAQHAVVEDVVRAWTDARLLTLTADDAGERWVTVSHEALIRAWPRLRKWIDEDRAGQRLHRQITDAAQEWQRLGRDDSALLRGLRLGQAREFQTQQHDALNDLELAFLAASDALQRAETSRRERARRQVVAGLSSGIAVAAALAMLASWQWRRAEQQRTIATARGITSQSDLLRTRALATAPGWADLLRQSALLAVEARRLRPDRDNARALRAAADVVGRAPRSIDVPVEALRGISRAADRLAVASSDGAALDVWDVDTGRVMTTIPRAASQFGAVFSPGGTYLLVLHESTVSAWQPRAGASSTELWKLEAKFPDNEPHRPGAAFSPDEKTVAVIDGTSVLLLDAATGLRIRRFEHDLAVTQIAFSGDGRRLASASGNTGSIFTISTGAVARVHHPDEISLLAIDERGTRLATKRARHIEVWDAVTADRLTALDVLPGSDDVEYIETVAFDETGARLGVIGEEGSGLQFSLSPLKETKIGATYTDTQWLRGLNPRFLGYTADGAIEIWDLPAAQPMARVIQSAGTKPVAFVYAPDAHRLVLFDEQRTLVYDTAPGTEVSRGSFGDAATPGIAVSGQLGFTSEYGGLVPVSLSRDGAVLLAAARSGTTRAWNVAAGPREIWRGSSLDAVALSPGGRTVVGAGPDDAIRAWDLASGKEAWRVAGVNAKVTVKDDEGDDVLRPDVLLVAFSDDDQRIAVRLRNRPQRVFEAGSGREVPGDAARVPVRDVGAVAAVSPDGALHAAVSGNNSEQIRLSRVDGDRELALVRHDADPDLSRNRVVALAFSPDSRFLVTGGLDRTARVWDLTGQELAFIRHDAPLVAVAFSADGGVLVTAAEDRSVRTWMWRDADLQGRICERLTRNLSPKEWSTLLGDATYAATCDKLSVPER
jgi:WD40 repeat protein